MTNNTPDYNDNLYFKKLQKSKNVANNVTNENLQDLTEQWKKGELTNGSYYVKHKDGEIETAEYKQLFNEKTQSFYFKYDFEDEISEVLAPVPTFEEWKAKLRALDAAHKTIKMEDETINRLVCSGKQLNYENAKLKELLKECREVIKNVDTYYGNYDSAKGYLVINKIDEVLK